MAPLPGPVNGNGMAADEDEDAFREAMATLGVKPGGRSAYAPAGRARAGTARPPEVLDELDFDAVMRADPATPAGPRSAAADRGLPDKDGARTTPAAARDPGAHGGGTQRPAPSRTEVSAADRELFERALRELDGGTPKKPEAAAATPIVRPAPRPVAPDYARLLKHGRLGFDATCDLHGAVREDARAQLGRFFEEAAKESWRVLRIVVGKGYHSVGEPVLGGAVRGWLAGIFSQDVELVLDAPEAAGGSGALVVITRRR